MPVTIWEYETVKVSGDDPDQVREILRPLGEKGFRLMHVQSRLDGSLLMILARDTGRPIEHHEELLEPVFTDSQMETIAINWASP